MSSIDAPPGHLPAALMTGLEDFRSGSGGMRRRLFALVTGRLDLNRPGYPAVYVLCIPSARARPA
jgi:hypothetical protein